MAPQKQTPSVHYELNVCGGRFETVKERFQAWKREPLIARPERLMFEGKTEVRRLDARCFDDTEAARAVRCRTPAGRRTFSRWPPLRAKTAANCGSCSPRTTHERFVRPM